MCNRNGAAFISSNSKKGKNEFSGRQDDAKFRSGIVIVKCLLNSQVENRACTNPNFRREVKVQG